MQQLAEMVMSVPSIRHLDPRPFIRQSRYTCHAATTLVMTILCLVPAFTGHTLHSSAGYSWFIDHGPGTDRGWAIIFGVFSIAGWAGVLIQNRYVNLVSASTLAIGHLIVIHGFWESNQVGTAAFTFTVVFLMSIVVFWLVLEEEVF